MHIIETMSSVVLTSSSHGDDAIFLVKQFLIEHDRLYVAVEQERNSLSLESHASLTHSLTLAKHVQIL